MTPAEAERKVLLGDGEVRIDLAGDLPGDGVFDVEEAGELAGVCERRGEAELVDARTWAWTAMREPSVVKLPTMTKSASRVWAMRMVVARVGLKPAGRPRWSRA